jgi:CheY-like chemotaxis protein
MHVLVVDDNLLSRTQITSQVRRAGWDVTAVAADPPVLARLRHARPDVVVVNLAADLPASAASSRPAGRAVAFVRALRSTAALAAVPVLGFCGHTDRRRREEGLASGCTKVATNASVASSVAELIQSLIAAGSAQGGRFTT